MAKDKNEKGRKMNHEDRMVIQSCLAKGLSPGGIAREIGFSLSAVYRELERGSRIVNPGAAQCETLRKSKAAVCNFCMKRGWCTKEKRFYDCTGSWEKASALRSSSRSGTRLTDEQIAFLDGFSEQLRNTRSVHHVFVSNPEIAETCCERTFRRTVGRGLLSVKAHELRRYMRFPRKAPAKTREISLKKPEMLVGRTWSKMQEYLKEHPKAMVVQFDSVIGRTDDRKAILTITFPRFGLQVGRVVEKGVASSAVKAIRKVMRKAKEKGYEDAFEVCLCDNGSEFSSFYEIEQEIPGRVHAFYARPYRSNDKAEAERNHEFLRYRFPKGKSLDSITQQMVDEAYDDINSTIRASRGDRTPYEIAERALGRGFLDALRVRKVDRRKVRLDPLI